MSTTETLQDIIIISSSGADNVTSVPVVAPSHCVGCRKVLEYDFEKFNQVVGKRALLHGKLLPNISSALVKNENGSENDYFYFGIHQTIVTIFGLPLLDAGDTELNDTFFSYWNKDMDNEVVACLDCHQIISELYNAFQNLQKIADGSSTLLNFVKDLYSNVAKKPDLASSQTLENKPIKAKGKRGRKKKVQVECEEDEIITVFNEAPSDTAPVVKSEITTETNVLEDCRSEIEIEPPTSNHEFDNECLPSPDVTTATEEHSQNADIFQNRRISPRTRKAKRVPGFKDVSASLSTSNANTRSSTRSTNKDVGVPRKRLKLTAQLWEVLKSDLPYYNERNLDRDDDGKFLCPDAKCTKAFTGLTTLNRHTLSHDLVRTYSCSQCSKGFKNLNEIKKHLKQKHCGRRVKGGKLRAVPCKSKSTDDNVENTDDHEHDLTSEQDEETPPDETCNPGGPVEGKGESQDSAEMAAQSRCAICNQRFRTIASLTRHINNEHDKAHCPECPLDFAGKSDLAAHFEATHDNSTNSCRKCDESFSTFELLRQHHESVHKLADKDADLQNETEETSTAERSYKCPQCSKLFKRSNHLAEHIVTHNKTEARLGCSLCPRKFYQPRSLRRHLVSHNSSESNTCEECGKSLSRRDHLKKHMESVHKKQLKELKNVKAEYRCTHCDKRFVRREYLHLHLRSHTEPKPPKQKRKRPSRSKAAKKSVTESEGVSNISLSTENPTTEVIQVKTEESNNVALPQSRCTICSQCFDSISSLSQHINKDHAKEHCPECPLSFIAYLELKTHYETAHDNNAKSCQKCDHSFDSFDLLYQHCKEAHNLETTESGPVVKDFFEEGDIGTNSNEERPFQCHRCKKLFKRQHHLTDHMLTHNQTKAALGCSICPQEFFQSRSLRLHLEAHTSAGSIRCDECGRAFKRRDHLRSHMKAVHRIEPAPTSRKRRPPKPKVHVDIVCSVCNKQFARKEYLHLHMRIHTGEKPYMCSNCGKTFRDQRNLAQHLITHETARPYCCSTCGMTFKRPHHLHDHEETHMANVPRPFACTIPNCGKAFKLRKHLLSHELVHTGAKDHACHVCGKAFGRRDNLRQHIANVHGDELSTGALKHLRRTKPSKRNGDASVTEPMTSGLDPIVASTDAIETFSSLQANTDIITNKDN